MEDDMTNTTIYTVHGAMEPVAIGVVMQRREELDRKFMPVDVTPDLYRIARAYITTYRGTSDYVRDVRAKFEQYGRLFDAQVSGCLNWMVGEVKGELVRAVREDAAHTTTPAAPVATATTTAAVAVPNGIYTIVNPDGAHRTLKLEDQSFGTPRPGDQIVSYLSGSDNERNYTGFGFVRGTTVRMWRRFEANRDLKECAEVLVNMNTQEYRDAGLRYAIASGNCWRCGRTLTVPTSLAHGVGPECAKILGIDTGTRATKRVRVDFAQRDETLPPVTENPPKWGKGDGGAPTYETDPRKNDVQRATRHAPTRATRKPKAKVAGVLGPRPVRDDEELFPALTEAEVF
jgi:hypothetical protein